MEPYTRQDIKDWFHIWQMSECDNALQALVLYGATKQEWQEAVNAMTALRRRVNDVVPSQDFTPSPLLIRRYYDEYNSTPYTDFETDSDY